MNKIYKLAWSAVMGCWSAASELARQGKTNRDACRLIIASGLMAVSDITLAECTPEINSSATGAIICTSGNINIGNDLVINADIQSFNHLNTNMTNDGKINGNVNLFVSETTLQNNGTIYGSVNVVGNNAIFINDGMLDNETDIIYHGPEANENFKLWGGDSASFINDGTVNKGVGIYSSKDARLVNNGKMNAEITQIAAEGDGRGIITVENHGSMKYLDTEALQETNIINSGTGSMYGVSLLSYSGSSSLTNDGEIRGKQRDVNITWFNSDYDTVKECGVICLYTMSYNKQIHAVSILNSGKVLSTQGDAVNLWHGEKYNKSDFVPPFVNITNTDSGEISAENYAINLKTGYTPQGTDSDPIRTATIKNSGVIQGDSGAINLVNLKGDFTQDNGKTVGDISMDSYDDSITINGGTVEGNINLGDGSNVITLDGGTLTGDIITGAGNDRIFLSSGKYSGTINTGTGDDLMYLGASQSDMDISEVTRLDGGENSDDDIGDSLTVLRDLTGSTSSEGKVGDVHISGWENIDIGTQPVEDADLMSRSAAGTVKTATLTLTGDLDVRGLVINSGSALALSDTTTSATVKGSLINAGTIDLTRQSSPSQTLSVTGDYTGSDALLKMNTVWNAPGDAQGGNSQSDLLDIAGTASGNTTVIPVSKDGRENVIDGDVRQVNHVINTVPVVKVRTSGKERAFTGTASTTGVSEVQLAKRTSNGVDEYFWTATAVETKDEGTQTDNGTRTDNGTQTDNETPVSPVTPSDKGSSGPQLYNSAVASYVSMPRVNMEQGYSTVATLHERRGENMALPWNAATPADGQTWGRLLGEHLKQDGKTRLDVHTDTYGFQFGHDLLVTGDEDGVQRLTGGYVAYTRSDSSFYDRYRAEHGIISGDKYAGKGKSEAWSLGVTDTYYTAGGSYLDLVGQFSYLRNHYESRDNVKVSQNGWSGLLSAEAGHQFILSGTDTGPGWLLEPQAQLAYQYVSLQKFSDGVRDVDQNSQSGLRGRVGARLSWNAQKGAERGTGTFYTLANLNHDFVKPGHVDIGRDSVREKYASTWMETGVGMQLPTGPSGYLYTEARYEKALGHTKRDGWQGTFGYKYTWK
ncbi:autotransporter outer membrane beta-barrel domain-containing protein [Escherichia coli]|nr:autotransporter outer membrane beta-barrel domain-containing protein [Escherichia coli]